MTRTARRAAPAALLVALAFWPGTAPAQQMVLSTEDQIIVLTNLVRAKNGLPPVTRSAQLTLAAAAHAQNMALTNTMSHQLGASGPAQRLRAVGYNWSTYGENIAQRYPTAQAVVDAWLKSPGHRANILNRKVTEIGVGVAFNRRNQPFYCQLFAHAR